MSPVFDTKTSPVETKYTDDLFNEITRGLNMDEVPEFFKMQAPQSINVCKGSWLLFYNMLSFGCLSKSLKIRIFTTVLTQINVNVMNDAEEKVILSYFGLTLPDINLGEPQADLDKRVRIDALLLFASKVARAPTKLKNSDYDEARQHCKSDEELFEIITMTALSVYALRVSKVLDIACGKSV